MPSDAVRDHGVFSETHLKPKRGFRLWPALTQEIALAATETLQPKLLGGIEAEDNRWLRTLRQLD